MASDHPVTVKDKATASLVRTARTITRAAVHPAI